MSDPAPNGESSSSSTSSSTNPAQSQPTSANTSCAACNQTPTTGLKPCNKCHSVSYCSRECLKADLKKHKKVCAAAAQIYAQTADLRPATTRPPPKDGHQRGLQKWQFDT